VLPLSRRFARAVYMRLAAAVATPSSHSLRMYKADPEKAYRGAAQLAVRAATAPPHPPTPFAQLRKRILDCPAARCPCLLTSPPQLMSPLPLLVALYAPPNPGLLKPFLPFDIAPSSASADAVLLVIVHSFFIFQITTWSLDSIKGAHRRTRFMSVPPRPCTSSASSSNIMRMYEQQDAVLRKATTDLLQSAPGYELKSPSKTLFQNAREQPVSPDPAFKPILDVMTADEELSHANNFAVLCAVPIAFNVRFPLQIPPFASFPLHNLRLRRCCSKCATHSTIVLPPTHPPPALHSTSCNPTRALQSPCSSNAQHLSTVHM
jgi:hypothetical protein